MAEKSVGRFIRALERDATLADRVAEQLLEVIERAGLKAGDPLPSERELGDSFGVSRTVVREAVRALIAQGVVEARPGARARVAAVHPSFPARSLLLYMRSNDVVDYEKVHEIRALLETAAAGLAAERAGADDLVALAEICEQMEAATDLEEAAAYDVDFHRLIAAATGNELFPILHDAIGEALIEVRRGNLRHGGRDEARESHRAILATIEQRDRAGAEQAMRRHLDAVARFSKQRSDVE
jgi:GntR family transcriptional repressor for pyruvate dehydrogenase complex